LHSQHTRRNFETTARRFLAELPMGLCGATVEDVRDALEKASHGVSDATRRQYVLRARSLLGYAHKLGYTVFNAGVTIKVRSESNRGATLAKRIVEVTDPQRDMPARLCGVMVDLYWIARPVLKRGLVASDRVID
jgi:integrase/recombinase XerD